MKKYQIIIVPAIILMACCEILESGESSHFFGYRTIGAEVIDSAHVDGALTLQGTKVKGEVFVNGMLSAVGVEMESLQVNGDASVKDTIINKDVIINGFAFFQHCTVKGTVLTASEKIVMVASQITGDVVMRKTTNPKEFQVLNLSKGTKIDGSVTFESGNGKIIMSKDSKITGVTKGARTFEQDE